MTPVEDSSCHADVGCLPLSTAMPTQTFTFTATVTGTATETPTLTPTIGDPTGIIDTQKCYRIKDQSDPQFQRLEVKLVDKFGTAQSAILKPFLACNPSLETNPSQTPGRDGSQLHPELHTVCFKLKDRTSVNPASKAGGVVLRVLFPGAPGQTPTPRVVKPEFVKEDLVCMAAAYIPPPPPTGIPCNINPGLPLKACPARTPAYVCYENVCLTPTPNR